MKNEKITTDNFINYLKELGYPEKSIAMQFSNGHNSHIDIAIIDNVTNVPIQLFEIKSNINDETIIRAITQINNYRGTLQNTDIPAYIVLPHNERPFFQIKKINGEKAETIDDLTSELNYEAQKYARVSEKKRNVVAEQEATLDEFKIFSWVLAGITLLIVILEKLSMFNFQFTSIDFYFLLTIVVLCLIPYFSKIKFWNIELERLKDKDTQKKNNL